MHLFFYIKINCGDIKLFIILFFPIFHRSFDFATNLFYLKKKLDYHPYFFNPICTQESENKYNTQINANEW